MSQSSDKLALNVDDLGMTVKEGLRQAAGLGVSIVQAGAIRGQLAPQELTESGRRHLRRYLNSLGLTLRALRADPGGGRFLDRAVVDDHIHSTCRILELARALDVDVVSAPIGTFQVDQPEQYHAVREALHAVAEQADRMDRCFAVETRVRDAAALQQLLTDLNCPNLAVCYDPAELLMDGQDPLAGVELLADHIRLAHVRDAELGSPLQPGRETNLGDGALPVGSYLNALREAGYHGPLVLRRAHSARPAADMRICRDYLDTLLQRETSRE